MLAAVTTSEAEPRFSNADAHGEIGADKIRRSRRPGPTIVKLPCTSNQAPGRAATIGASERGASVAAFGGGGAALLHDQASAARLATSDERSRAGSAQGGRRPDRGGDGSEAQRFTSPLIAHLGERQNAATRLESAMLRALS
jgi:hypothetical protein